MEALTKAASSRRAAMKWTVNDDQEEWPLLRDLRRKWVDEWDGQGPAATNPATGVSPRGCCSQGGKASTTAMD